MLHAFDAIDLFIVYNKSKLSAFLSGRCEAIGSIGYFKKKGLGHCIGYINGRICARTAGHIDRYGNR